MSKFLSPPLLLLVLLATTFAFADAKAPQTSARPMEKETRMMVIRSLNAEVVFVRKPFPAGEKGLTLKDGTITPGDKDLRMLIATYGVAAKPGDRARITNVEIKRDRIRLEINGGPKKKTKWYQRIQVGGPSGTVPVAPDNSDPNPRGSFVDLVFDKYVPEMTGDQIRELLSPVLDFHAKSAVEAYLDTVPPKVKEAIKNHEVLVGMNREMVTYAKGRPNQKIREKEADGTDYEEWLYGVPPQEVDFVRFVGDEVVRLEQMKVDGTKVVRVEKEVDVNPVGVTLAKEESKESPKKPSKVPTLRRPGEKPESEMPTIGSPGTRVPDPGAGTGAPTQGPGNGPGSFPRQ